MRREAQQSDIGDEQSHVGTWHVRQARTPRFSPSRPGPGPARCNCDVPRWWSAVRLAACRINAALKAFNAQTADRSQVFRPKTTGGSPIDLRLLPANAMPLRAGGRRFVVGAARSTPPRAGPAAASNGGARRAGKRTFFFLYHASVRTSRDLVTGDEAYRVRSHVPRARTVNCRRTIS